MTAASASRSALLALAGGGFVAAQLTRPSGIAVTDTLWAEDGQVFLATALDEPGPAVWLRPYQGYLHLLPRMIAAIDAALPLVDLATGMAVLSAVVAAGCVVLFALGLQRWLPQFWMPAALVVVLAANRSLAGEVAANAANLHWFATLGLTGLALVPVRSWWFAAIGAVAAAVLALTDPFSVPVAALALVVLAARLVRYRRNALPSAMVAVSMAGGAVAQLVTTLQYPRTAAAAHSLRPSAVAESYLRLVVEPSLVWGHPLRARDVIAAMLGLAALTLLLWVVFPGRSRQLLMAAALLGTSFALFGFSVGLNTTISERYVAAPSALLTASALVFVAGAARVNTVLVSVVCAALISGVAVVGWQVSFSPRGEGPGYRHELRAARAVCLGVPSLATVEVALTPDLWGVVLSCDDVIRGR